MRKIFFICVTVLICSIKLYAQTYDVIPQSQWEQLKEVRDSIGEISNLDSLYEDRVHPNGLPYHIYIPDNLEHDIDYPLVIFLHGYTDLTIHTHKGFPKGIWSLPMVQNDHPHILFVPRYRNNADKWFNEQYREMFYETLNALITELNNNSDIANIDTSRIYLTGFSEGGMGTWNYIRNYPNKFAAAAPLSGFFEGPQNENEATEIKHIPIWMFNGDGDNGVTGSRTSYDMLNAVEAPDVRYHEYQDHGHVIDDFAYFTEGFMDWFFFHNLNTTPIDNNVMGNQIDFQLFQNYPNPFNSQ
ncbi:dienelactone hydrolase family protein, partial [candidate division KSB1 bacterium]|nr:dienelactone hydrolase family protein [candidate division KSB1 bacterium]